MNFRDRNTDIFRNFSGLILIFSKFSFFHSLSSVKEKLLESTISIDQVIAWRWAVIIAFAVPEIGTWIRALRLYCFKKIKNFGWKEFFMVFLAESFHVAGMSLLAFVVLPELDSMQGAMVTNLFCCIPSVLCKYLRILRI